MPAASDPPNIVFIFSDQQRWDTVGVYGQRLPVTPNLDRLAVSGVRFQNAFTCQPVCGPARACIQTGRYATEVGCWRNGIALPLDAKTIAHYASEAGYETGYVGKWHLASTRGGTGMEEINLRTEPVPPERRGGWKDYWVASDVLEFTSHSYDGHMFDADGNRREFPEGRYRVDCVTDFGLEFIRSRSAGTPFFLFISYIEPHHQNDHNRYEGPEGSKEKFGDYDVPGDLIGQEGDWARNYPDYLGCCNAIDRNAGRILEALDETGAAQNTLVIYTSDHGSHFRTRNGEYKRSCHDACIRVPMIMNGPGFEGGKVVQELVSIIDLPPTILRAAGVEPPRHMQGRPVQDLVEGTARDWPQEVFLQISESQVGRAIRTGKWKYSITAPDRNGGRDPGSTFYIEDFLYDLEADPHERDNLVRDPGHAGVRKELCEILKRRMKQAGEKEPGIEPAP